MSGDRGVVVSVAFPYAPMGPKAVGGAEVVCSLVEAALGGLGYGSAVVAHAASEPAGHLYGTEIPAGVITDEVRAEVEARHQANLDRAMAENDVVLVHMHGLDFDRYRVPEEVPVLVTLHLPPGWYPESVWRLPERYQLVCVSESQRRACPAEAQARVRVVGNGVPMPPMPDVRRGGRYALMLARICAEKNLHVGFEAGRMAGMPVLLGGDVFPYEAHLRYFAEEIEPRLTAAGSGHEARQSGAVERPAARFLGPVAGEEKRRLLERATCLLLPSLAPETSSMVAMEALAAGVPVIGMAVGAVPEIVEDGRTGFLVDPGVGSTERMAEALRRAPALDRAVCRAEAERRFPVSRMVEGYGGLYAGMADGRVPRARTLAADAAEVASSARVAATGAALAVQELRSEAAFEGLREEWAALWAEDPQATPFQHPAWLLPWWRQFGPDGELCALALRGAEGELAGLLPMYTYQPAGGERVLLPVGAGTTDYLDGVWAPWAGSAAECGLQYARQRMAGWDVASLQQLRLRSSLLAAATGAAFAVSESESCSSLPVARELPGKMRVNLARYQRLAEAEGGVRCELVTSEAEVLAAFEALVRFHGERWQEGGVLEDPRVLAHHRESLPALLRAGLLRLFRLERQGETIAVLYGLADREGVAERRLYLYLIGFDSRFGAISPGSLLVHGASLHAREHGFARLDLLRGGEGYKRLWGAETERTFGLSFRPAAG